MILRPVLTEKSLFLATKGWYTFAVSKAARKENISRDIEVLYKVQVTDIRTIAMHGKVRKAGKKMQQTVKPDWKKALVQLKDGQTIDAFNVGEQGK